jgi:hypothetical protein
MLAGVGNGLTDDLLVAKMHAIKHTNGQADLAAAITQVARGVNEFHSNLWYLS